MWLTKRANHPSRLLCASIFGVVFPPLSDWMLPGPQDLVGTGTSDLQALPAAGAMLAVAAVKCSISAKAEVCCPAGFFSSLPSPGSPGAERSGSLTRGLRSLFFTSVDIILCVLCLPVSSNSRLLCHPDRQIELWWAESGRYVCRAGRGRTRRGTAGHGGARQQALPKHV